MQIAFIIFLGTALRLISLNQSLWLDEATTAIVAKMSISEIFTKFMPADFHPPLYYLVINLWSNLFGISEMSLRIPSVIFGVLTVYITYLISKEVKLKMVYLPSLLLATSGLHIYYSQEARMYAMACFLVSLCVYFFLKNKWIFLSILLPVLFLTDYLSILIVPALFIYCLFSRRNLKKLILSVIPLGLSFFVWFPVFFQQIQNGLSVKDSASGWWNILGQVTYKNILLIPTKFLIGRVGFDNKVLYGAVITILIGITVLVILKSKSKIAWSWFGICLTLGVILSLFIPTLTYFRYLFVLPAFYLLIADGISYLSKRYINLAIIFFLTVNVLSSTTYLLNNKFHREDWRDIANHVGSSKIVFPANSQKEALIYYKKAENIISKDELTVDVGDVWLSRYTWNIFDPDDTARKYIENLGYNWSEELNLNGVVFWKYTYENRN